MPASIDEPFRWHSHRSPGKATAAVAHQVHGHQYRESSAREFGEAGSPNRHEVVSAGWQTHDGRPCAAGASAPLTHPTADGHRIGISQAQGVGHAPRAQFRNDAVCTPRSIPGNCALRGKQSGDSRPWKSGHRLGRKACGGRRRGRILSSAAWLTRDTA